MLFGHQNDANQPAPDQNQGGVNPLAVDPASGVSLPVAPQDQWQQQPQQPQSQQFTPPAPVQPQTFSPTPPALDATVYGSSQNYGAPDSGYAQTAQTPAQPTDITATPDQQNQLGDDVLLDLKQQALEQLSPLVSHLEQSPEEKFRTTMMMIQSSDNQALIKDAYTAAQAITDDKARAQALLDIVNEINYFTQQP